MHRRALLLSLGSLIASAPAQAFDIGTVTLSSSAVPRVSAVGQTCTAALWPRGVSRQTLIVPAAGQLSATLDGRLGGRDDWDLALFDAGSRRLLAGSAAFGSREQLNAAVTAGQRVVVQACHRAGDAAPPRLRVTEAVADGTLPKPQPLQLARIRFGGRADLQRLLTLGLDLNETARGHTVYAVLRGDDARTLRRAGFAFAVAIKDLRAADRAALRSPARLRRAGGALPSGRVAYRTLADYQNDLKQLVDENPGLVRTVTLPHPSVKGTPVEGVEIAKDVDATGDGRPTHVEMGLHHAREWSSGEATIEFGIDLVKRYKAGDPRVVKLLEGSRTFIFPVINPDGFDATMQSGGFNALIDDDPNAALPQQLLGLDSYRRKNCADTLTGSTATPCALANGVDLNRNYGAFWGGPGESDNPQMQTYRGPAPFSEPEARNVHEWSSAHQVMVLNSNHNFAADVLYQPGFSARDEPGLKSGTKVPYTDEMRTVATDMATAAGYVAMPSYQLYDVTGATEDWNYFAQGTFGYTTEIGYDNFHPNYQDAVIDQYTGARDGTLDQAVPSRTVSLGLQESFLRAGEAAMNPAYHSVISGTAPAGAILKLTKDFQTTTSNVITNTDSAPVTGAPLLLDEHLETTLTVPASGSYEWHVNPSTRPLTLIAGATEAWTLSCGTESRQVTVAMGQTATENLTCVAAPPGTPPATPAAPARPVAVVKPKLRLSTITRTGRRRLRLRFTTTAPVTVLRATLRSSRGTVLSRTTRARVSSIARLTFTTKRPLRAGRYTVTVSVRSRAGVTVTTSRKLTLRR